MACPRAANPPRRTPEAYFRYRPAAGPGEHLRDVVEQNEAFGQQAPVTGFIEGEETLQGFRVQVQRGLGEEPDPALLSDILLD